MNTRTMIITLAAAALALATPRHNVAQDETPSFQLVYHSDTRGYYRPCG